MALDFPATPTNNDLYTIGTKTWRYNGYGWQLEGANNILVIGEAVGNVTGNGQVLYVNTTNTVQVAANLVYDNTGIVNILSGMKVDGQTSGKIVSVAANTVDLNEGNYFTKTISANTTFVFSNPHTSRAVGFVLKLTNGGSATVGWPANTKWPGGTPPTLTVTGIDILSFITDDGGTTWRGVVSMLDSK